MCGGGGGGVSRLINAYAQIQVDFVSGTNVRVPVSGTNVRVPVSGTNVRVPA